MLLAIEQGNTNTLFAIHSDGEWIAQWRAATDASRTADEYAVWLSQLLAMAGLSMSSLDRCIVSSVVPQSIFNLRNLSRRYLEVEPMIVGENVELGIAIRIQKPSEAGADRLVNAIGAHITYPGALLVVDSGTATTFDIVGSGGAFEGGAIAPGINLSMQALHSAAARLPRVGIQRPAHVIGKDTVEAMQSGVFWGYISLIEGLIARMKLEYTDTLTVIGTGGVASLFEGATTAIDHFDHDLTILGLLEIVRRNPHFGGKMKKASNDELVFLPLGGSNEIGMNFNLYGYGPPHARKWIVVDLGVTFGDQTTPGVEIILPDPTFIEEYARDILGIVLTHAHEDHIGAVAWLWPRLKAPLYATPFTAFLLREKLREQGLLGEAPIIEVPLNGKITLGPFDLSLITLTHSIPEPNGVAIRTPLGTILHTGDWKIDPDPLTGSVTDAGAIRALGDEGVLAMVCDSTNIFVDGEAGSEAEVRETCNRLIGELKGRVATACFASNVARMDTIIRAAERAGRRVCLVGRSMIRMSQAARSVGLLADIAPFVPDTEARYFPPEKILYLCTGSQGEPRAALSRIAEGNHPYVTLGAGDACVFSSRIIPGNDIPIRNLQNKLADRGVRLYTERDHPGIHVSGHPCRDELKRMYQWARPAIAVPTHGERRHLLEHAAFAKDLQVPHAIAPRNGEMVRLAPGAPGIIDEVPSGRLYVDAGVVTAENGDALRERRHASFNGVLTICIVLDGRNKIVSGPAVRGLGLPGDADYPLADAMDDLAEEAKGGLQRLSADDRDDDRAVEAALSRTVKKAAFRIWKRRPVVETTVLRV